MADVTENDLRAAIKALVDVVAPSVSSTDPLASEQLRLVVESLDFMRSRLDKLYDRDRFELLHHLDMTRALADLGLSWTEPTAALLGRTLAAGEAAKQAAGVSSVSLKAASAGLAAAAREMVRESAAMPVDARRQVDLCVLARSEDRIRFDRAWFLPMGFDPAPAEVQSLESLLDAAP